MTTSRNAYQTVNTSATLQEESMTVKRVVSEYLKEAKDCGFESDVDGKAEVIWIKARLNEAYNVTDVTKDSIYFFVRDKSDNKLRFCSVVCDGTAYVDDTGHITSDGISVIESSCYTSSKKKFSVVADYVTAWSFQKIPAFSGADDGTDLACVNVTYTYLDKNFTDTISAVTRNKTHTPAAPEGGGGS